MANDKPTSTPTPEEMQSKAPNYMDEVNKNPQSVMEADKKRKSVAIKENTDVVKNAEAMKLVDRKNKLIKKVNGLFGYFDADTVKNFVNFETVVNNLFYDAETTQKQKDFLNVLEKSLVEIEKFAEMTKKGLGQGKEIDFEKMYEEFNNVIYARINALGLKIDPKGVAILSIGLWACGIFAGISGVVAGSRVLFIAGAGTAVVSAIILGGVGLVYGRENELETSDQRAYDILNEYLDRNTAESPEMKDFLLTLGKLADRAAKNSDIRKEFIDDISALKSKYTAGDKKIDKLELSQITAFIKEKYLKE
jgi:hypothetical protein